MANIISALNYHCPSVFKKQQHAEHKSTKPRYRSFWKAFSWRRLKPDKKVLCVWRICSLSHTIKRLLKSLLQVRCRKWPIISIYSRCKKQGCRLRLQNVKYWKLSSSLHRLPRLVFDSGLFKLVRSSQKPAVYGPSFTAILLFHHQGFLKSRYKPCLNGENDWIMMTMMK